MGLTPVPADRLATVVTTMEMRARPLPRPLPPSRLRLVRWPAPAPDKYRALFCRVGSPWLWYSRLLLDDATLIATTHADTQSVFAVVDAAGIEVGLLELGHRPAGECIVDYFALIPELTGQGHGRWLMAKALALAWTARVSRVWLNTCTLDHPSALNFYRAQGFVPVRRAVETFPDPRLIGLLPREAAPHIPLLE